MANTARKPTKPKPKANPTPRANTAPKLSKDQRLQLLTWLAADYDASVIAVWFEENKWPPVSRALLTYYRKRHQAAIEALRKARHSDALNTGLALVEERVARLKAHADRLEAIKWVAGKSGKLYNEKAWRETLDEIAQETGGRVVKAQISGPGGGPIPFYGPADVAGARAALDAWRALTFPPEAVPDGPPDA